MHLDDYNNVSIILEKIADISINVSKYLLMFKIY